MAEKCRNCYDLESTIRQLEDDAGSVRVARRAEEQSHAEDLRRKDAQLHEMDERVTVLGRQIQQLEHFRKECEAILGNPSMHSMLSAVVRDYERMRATDAVPV